MQRVQSPRRVQQRGTGGDSIAPRPPRPGPRHTRANHVPGLHRASTGYRPASGVVDIERRALSTSFASTPGTMAEPTNPTSPEQILADVPGKWSAAKDSGELLFFDSTERIIPGDFPVSAAEKTERSDGCACERTSRLL